MSNASNLPTEQLLELLLTLKKTTPTAARTILNGQPAIAYALISLMVQMNAINIDVFQKTLTGFQATAAQTAAAPPAAQAHAIPPATAPHIPPHAHPHAVHHPPPATGTPISAVPPHMQNAYANPYNRTGTPPHPAPTPAMGAPPPQAVYGGYPVSNGYGAPPPQQPPAAQYPPPGAPYGHGHGHGHGYPPPHPPAQGYPPPQHAQPTPAPQPAASMPPGLAETLAAIPDDQKALIYRVISMTPEQINALPPQERSTYIQIAVEQVEWDFVQAMFILTVAVLGRPSIRSTAHHPSRLPYSDCSLVHETTLPPASLPASYILYAPINTLEPYSNLTCLVHEAIQRLTSPETLTSIL
ncbi:hypothetical protein CC1G_10098 [Coprinopsis cinerea okayama7|uniref:Cleavage stimulation factor subunit 2 hinge domain-containing protein n=1 Tax=Coprinopsis cinerea (strain Okayama-7 / 130 / ATCC MYA-4618 / FGSC 9003) TaxID=240176 RepID=A8N3X3_COPC7|nr:hypothetical protein CC1G_10098 [Coprinopsis cinerea okayama7\|eukprot:XP_001829568.2 hypothetical protein CC1G_10098 [Coprinopsis cinerea okayama7\